MGTWRNWNLARLRAKEQVGGSNPLVPSIFYGFVAQSEFRAQEFESWGCGFKSCRSHFDFGFAIADFGFSVSQIISGSSNDRTHDFGSWNRGLNPFPEANFSGRSTEGYMGWTWNPVFASSNLAAQTKILFADVAQSGRGTRLRSVVMWVQISPSVPISGWWCNLTA